MFSLIEIANFTRENKYAKSFMSCIGRGLCRILSTWMVFGDTRLEGENFGMSAPFYFYLIMKKFFTLIILCIFSIGVIHADITWTLSDDGTLTISGTDMPKYSSGQVPWYSQKDKIKKIIIKNGVTNIGGYAFEYCSGLTSITIPNSVTSIGEHAFSGCSDLPSIIIPNSVTSIENSTFSYCSGLTSITIPNSVTSIGEDAFEGTKWYESQPDGLVYAGKILYEYKGTMPSNTKIDIKIKEGTTSIGEYAFENCPGLTSVNIPNSVMSIGKGAFCSCYGLISVIIPNSVTSIGEGVFHSCKNLTSVTIPNSVTSIKEETFEGCSGLKSVIIPNSVTSIEDEVFKGCSSLKSITCEANTPPSFLLEYESQVFKNVDRSIPVYVPANSVDQYKAADEWKEFTNIQAIPDVNTLIDEKSFNANPSSGLVYDLNGKVINDNTPKFGIYIRNGKKVVIK